LAGRRQLKGDLYVPHGEGPFPAVLLLHGGGWKAGSRRQMIYHAKRLAPNGYVAFAIDYRLAPEHKFPAQIEDCRAAVQFMRNRAAELEIDPNRIAAYGYSAGGQLACLLGTTDGELNSAAGIRAFGQAPETRPLVPNSSRVQAVVAGGAPCDFEIVPADALLLAYWLGGSRAELPALYRAASPLAAVTPDDAPMLFYHGQKDTVVPMFTAMRMKERLDANGVKAAFHLCENKGHYRAFLDASAFQRALAFLNEELKPVAPVSVTTHSQQPGVSVNRKSDPPRAARPTSAPPTSTVSGSVRSISDLGTDGENADP
jgi:triacylglycerol lipase